MMLLKRLWMAGVAVLLWVNVAAAEKIVVPEFLEGTERVSAEQLIELVSEVEDLILVDARKVSDYQKGYIEGAVSLPDIETRPETLARVIPEKASPVLFYCNGVRCGRSVKAAQVAIAEGYHNIYWFRGGMQEWESKGLPVVHD